MFCKKLSNKKDRKLLKLWDGLDTIYAAAEAKGDTERLFALSYVSKDLLVQRVNSIDIEALHM